MVNQGEIPEGLEQTGKMIPTGSDLLPPHSSRQVRVGSLLSGGSYRTGGNGLRLCQRRVRLGIRRNFSMERVVGSGSGLPGEELSKE